MGLKRKPKNIVFFEDEIIKKEDADNLLSKLNETKRSGKKHNQLALEENHLPLKKAKKKHKKGVSEGEIEETPAENDEQSLKTTKKKKRKNVEETSVLIENDEVVSPKKIKKAKKKKATGENTDEQISTKNTKKAKTGIDEDNVDNIVAEDTVVKDKDASSQEDDSNEVTKPKPESKRSLKRKKHTKLLEEKKLKAELKMQQSVLNYLSKWKHARTEWKFEKLKQIWLQQNLFVVNKIPEEFWESTVEYFNGSKGAIRKVILKEALKIIEEDNTSGVENDDEDYLTRLRHAREIVQRLEE